MLYLCIEFKQRNQMETIVLNSENCKEYSDLELAQLLGLEEDNFDKKVFGDEEVLFSRKINNGNSLNLQIEPDFSGRFSYVIFDDSAKEIWIERFASTFEEAEIKGKKLFEKIFKAY